MAAIRRMNATHLLTWLYSMSGVAGIVSYGPQIRSAWRSTDGARDVSLLTWGFWCCTATVSTLYASLVVKDLPFALLSAGNLVGCCGVAGVAAWRRRRR